MIQFTQSMETGIAKIDQQHRELCDRINQVLTAGANAVTKEETEKLLQFLSDYVVLHFSDEEKLQQDSRYPGMVGHQAQHKAFIASLQQLQRDFHINGPSAKFTIAVNQTVIDWLVKHIRNVDMVFAKYYISVQ